MPQSAAALPIAPEDLATLRSWSAATHAPAVQVQRARILLLAAEGMANSEIAERLGVSRPTVIAWRKRYTGTVASGRRAAPASSNVEPCPHAVGCEPPKAVNHNGYPLRSGVPVEAIEGADR